MSWELTPHNHEVAETASRFRNELQGRRPLRVLNIGFGLGIVSFTFKVQHTIALNDFVLQFDTFVQKFEPPPCEHVIVEAHPDVLAYMKKSGWYEREGLTIVEGKWQDAIKSNEILQAGAFNIVYIDTFSESYQGQQISLFDFQTYR